MFLAWSACAWRNSGSKNASAYTFVLPTVPVEIGLLIEFNKREIVQASAVLYGSKRGATHLKSEMICHFSGNGHCHVIQGRQDTVCSLLCQFQHNKWNMVMFAWREGIVDEQQQWTLSECQHHLYTHQTRNWQCPRGTEQIFCDPGTRIWNAFGEMFL